LDASGRHKGANVMNQACEIMATIARQSIPRTGKYAASWKRGNALIDLTMAFAGLRQELELPAAR
jgi:hypothetical protein